jgi:hypothetical protein
MRRDFGAAATPSHALHIGSGVQGCTDSECAAAKNLYKFGVSVSGAKSSLAVNAFFGLHALDDPMNANLGGIGGVESFYVGESALPGALQGRIAGWIRTAVFQKIEKRYVGRVRVHLLENFIDLAEEVALS